MFGEPEGTADNRGAKRFDFLSRIEYTLDSPTSPAVHKGVSVNISENGMAVYVFRPHPEGQRLFIKSDLPITSRIATVRWIQQKDQNFYLTGLHFSDHTT